MIARGVLTVMLEETYRDEVPSNLHCLGRSAASFSLNRRSVEARHNQSLNVPHNNAERFGRVRHARIDHTRRKACFKLRVLNDALTCSSIKDLIWSISACWQAERSAIYDGGEKAEMLNNERVGDLGNWMASSMITAINEWDRERGRIASAADERIGE